jgi:5,10-methylenetetrahydrofolate reductase
LPLTEAYALARSAPNLVLGGVAIAERHVAKGDEHQRMLAKQDAGCRFFITQSVYDAASTKSLLSDYALSLAACGRSPAPVVLTFSPCGSVRTLEFMKWLGISFPRWLENELRHSADPLERSIDLCENVFKDVHAYAREKQLPIGINVESISIRKAEVDASVELYRRLSSGFGDTRSRQDGGAGDDSQR